MCVFRQACPRLLLTWSSIGDQSLPQSGDVNLGKVSTVADFVTDKNFLLEWETLEFQGISFIIFVTVGGNTYVDFGQPRGYFP